MKTMHAYIFWGQIASDSSILGTPDQKNITTCPLTLLQVSQQDILRARVRLCGVHGISYELVFGQHAIICISDTCRYWLSDWYAFVCPPSEQSPPLLWGGRSLAFRYVGYGRISICLPMQWARWIYHGRFAGTIRGFIGHRFIFAIEHFRPSPGVFELRWEPIPCLRVWL